jgi:hypothetical protein
VLSIFFQLGWFFLGNPHGTSGTLPKEELLLLFRIKFHGFFKILQKISIFLVHTILRYSLKFSTLDIVLGNEVRSKLLIKVFASVKTRFQNRMEIHLFL